jgi:tape measure domain-containing protein
MAMNMTAAVRIKASVDGQQSIDGLNKSLGATTKTAGGLKGAFQSLGRAGQSFIGILGSAGIGALATTFTQAGIEADRTAKRVENLAGQFGETAKLQDFANKSAKQFGIGQTEAANAVADLYARLRPTGSSLEQIQTAFTGVNNAALTMGLTSDQTSNVMLQLSQALGSGKLQGDEFRSVMEQLPSIGQAVASVLGVNVAELKNLSSEGKITSDVLLQALEKLSKQAPPPPDAYRQFQAALADLSTTIGTQVLPALTPLIQIATQALQAFSQLPAPVQTLAIAFAALAGALVLIAPAISAIVGIAGAIGPVIAALKAFGIAAAAVLSGPVGIVALVVAAGVAIYAFRDKIADAFGAIGKILVDAAAAFKRTFVDPVVKLAGDVVKGIANAFRGLADALRSPFDAVTRFIRNIFNGYLSLVEKFINSAVNGINKLIAAANRALSALKLPNIPLAPTVTIPRFAQGGTVDRPTLAMVGEGGQREYIIPESKMARASANYLMGARGAGVVPGATSSASQGNTTVQITTGPVLQQGGQRYVTIEDLERSLNSLAANLLGNNRSFAGRRFQGAI